MTDLIKHLHFIGVMFILLALVHIVFPKRFQWREDLSKISLLNRQMMHVHTFFIALFVLLNGLLFLFYAEDLMQPSHLQKGIVTGLLIFWTVRGIIQHAYYSMELWRGKKFETLMHVLFSLFWFYVILILALILKTT